MPTYHYSCEECKYEFEMEQKITDPPKRHCPKCRGSIYRVIHPVGHILKGSGFYRTDYRSEDFKKKEQAEKETKKTDEHKKAKKKKDEPGKSANAD